MDGASPLKVCIIGAGVAGLSAARVLHEAKVPFVIVEGSNRIGGRVFPFQHKGGFLQHGATFVNGDQNAIYGIAKKEGLIVNSVGDFDLFDDLTYVRIENDALTAKEKSLFSDFIRDLEVKYEEIAEDHPELTVKEVFDKDYKQFIESQPSNSHKRSSFDALARFYLSYYEMEWAANCSKMALANLVEWDNESENGDESYSLNSIGYKKIMDKLSASIPTEYIRLSKTVTTVNYEQRQKVLVHFADGSEEAFASVIITSSLGFLKARASSFFVPPLPEQKMNAIEAIGFGDMQKLFLEYERPFWKENENSIKTIGLSTSPLLDRGNLFEVVEWDRKTLTLWLSGPAVAYAARRSDDELKVEITDHLRKAFGDDSIEHPSKIMRHTWRKDNLILGSYSYLTPEAVELGDANAILADPINARNGRPLICFAGEATHSTFYQTTCGAYLSGEREANRLIITGDW